MNLKSYTHIIKNIAPLYAELNLELRTISSLAKANLYYLLGAMQMITRFPFYLNCASFNNYLILYTHEGIGTLIYDGQTHLLHPNTIVFIDCNKPFKLDLSHSNKWKFDIFLINGPHIQTYFDAYYQNNNCVCLLSPISNLPLLATKLLNHTCQPSLENDFIISKLITDLLTELILAKDLDLTHTLNLPQYLIEIKKLFDSNYKDHFNLDELANTYHISKYKIIRDFTTYLDNSPINYLIERRINAAKKLLVETDYPVYEIASMVGIDNINHFTNLFKKSVHMTPNQFRKTSQIDRVELLGE